MPPYIFYADCDGTSQKYTLDIKDGNPIKLGDGSFGSVFQVTGQKGSPAAVKIFYDSSDPGVQARCRDEVDAATRIRDALRALGLPGLERQLVLPIASTFDFTAPPPNHPVENSASSFLQRHGYSVSKNAIVMELYTCTLKDILERGAPAGRQLRVGCEGTSGSPGYDLLANLRDQRSRERIILPIINKVCMGLRALHAASCQHADLKPANVLVRNSGGSLDIALADFGFLVPGQFVGSGYVRVGEAWALGTRHYRSCEQKDYFDICEVDVTLDGAPAGRGDVRLVTRDRKFNDSIIEEGDIAVFSKDPKRLPFEIGKVIRSENDSTLFLRPGHGTPHADQRTQVVLYKRQTLRTDLFGLGAIIYDLLTLGRSAELFYDYLRIYDRPAEGPARSGGGSNSLGRCTVILAVSRHWWRSISRCRLALLSTPRFVPRSTIFGTGRIKAIRAST